MEEVKITIAYLFSAQYIGCTNKKTMNMADLVKTRRGTPPLDKGWQRKGVRLITKEELQYHYGSDIH